MARRRTQAEIRDICDRACEILKKTRDGDDLDPSDLKLTELAVNCDLNNMGEIMFNELYQSVVVDGTYVKPYLHGIEHITRDHEGYIYYKGIHVEHYDRDWVYSEDAKNNLLELKRRCEFLERKGIEVSCNSVTWGWGNYADEYGAERLKEINALVGKKAFMYSRVEIYNSGRDFVYFVCGTPGTLDDIKNHPVTQGMIGRYFDDEYVIKTETFIYDNNSADKIIMLGNNSKKSKVESLLPSCHDYMKKHNQLEVSSVKTHKTDFAEGYDNTKKLDALLNAPGRSLQYSVVDIWGRQSNISRSFAYGMPAFDEIKECEEYKRMDELYGVLSVCYTTFLYGSGEPLKNDELPPFEETELVLSDVHDYLIKHDLVQETRWENCMEKFAVNRTPNNQTEPDYEADGGYEP